MVPSVELALELADMDGAPHVKHRAKVETAKRNRIGRGEKKTVVNVTDSLSRDFRARRTFAP
jgi:hypothetical protein